MTMPGDFQLNPDDLTREQLVRFASLPWSDLALVLDDWVCRRFAILSSHHGVGLFLKLLNEEGWEITRKPSPVTSPPPTE
jgi:hypothetical protein